MLNAFFPVFPAYATWLDKLGWYALRLVCVGVLMFLLLPILVIIPLSFSNSTFLSYPIPGWAPWRRSVWLASTFWAKAHS